MFKCRPNKKPWSQIVPRNKHRVQIAFILLIVRLRTVNKPRNIDSVCHPFDS